MAFYDNISLEKGMYNSEKSFTNLLESLDPTANYKGSDIANLDAYERQLKRFDIKVKGFNSDSISKFFQSSSTATLFPEFVKRCVLNGMNENSILNNIVATNTKINALDYRPITTITPDANKVYGTIAENALIPATEIKVQENLIKLEKRGRMLTSTYEAIKFQRLDLFSVTLKQIGAFISKAQLKDAIGVIIDGDTNANPADTSSVITAGTLKYSDLIALWSKFEDYQMNRLLVSPDVMAKMLNLAELKDPSTGLNFHTTGKLSTPFGATLYSTNAVPTGTIIGLDKNCALEMITGGELSVDSDKLIDRQLERTAITSINGFAKIFKDASLVLTV